MKPSPYALEVLIEESSFGEKQVVTATVVNAGKSTSFVEGDRINFLRSRLIENNNQHFIYEDHILGKV